MTTPTTTRAAWLREHDIVTWRVDMGIGVTWFAMLAHGDLNFCGQTEDEAIANLAWELGIKLWGEV